MSVPPAHAMLACACKHAMSKGCAASPSGQYDGRAPFLYHHVQTRLCLCRLAAQRIKAACCAQLSSSDAPQMRAAMRQDARYSTPHRAYCEA